MTATPLLPSRWLPVAAALLLGCVPADPTVFGHQMSDGEEETEGEEGEGEEAEEPDRTDEIFVRSRLLEVQVDIDPDDWETLSLQEREGLDIEPPECDLPPSPYSWFSAQVTVDGEVFENVGIRKKGFIGSKSVERPSLKIRFDKFVEDQTFSDAKRLTLNNSKQDKSYLRQCLAYDLFRAVGTPTPRCNFAHVVVNGLDLGVYVNVDAIKKPFIRRYFDDDDGTLFEGTLSDFRDDWTGTFEQKTNKNTPDFSAINTISAALETSDEQLIEALSRPIDLDAFITFWAAETMTAHWDGYAGDTNNFYFYDDPTSGKVHFLPWGTDATFVQPLMLFEDSYAPRSINAAGLIARRLYLHPDGQALYLDRLLSLLDDHFDPDAMEDSIKEMAEIFGSALPDDIENEAREAMYDTVDFVHEQDDLIREEIETGPVPWDASLRRTLCR